MLLASVGVARELFLRTFSTHLHRELFQSSQDESSAARTSSPSAARFIRYTKRSSFVIIYSMKASQQRQTHVHSDTQEPASLGLVPKPEPTQVDSRLETFRHWIKEQGLKETAQRDEIAKVFLASDRHMSVEELVNAVRQISPRVSYATVYRTIRLLMECGFAEERHFADGQARFENVAEAGHHDHLICERCGRIVEFVQPQIEQLQGEIAKRFGFVSTNHKVEIYGICQDCRKGRA